MLGEQIRRLRSARGMSQADLANRLAVSKQSVSNWENNNIQPSIDMLIKLADLFSVSTDVLLGLNNHRYIDVTELSDSQTAHIQMLIDDLTEHIKENKS